MTLDDFKSDISLSLAVSAYNGTSMSPDRRGQETITEYAQQLMADYEMFRKNAIKGNTKQLLDGEFARYREGYRQRLAAYLQSASRTISWFITGPANFPIRSAQKRSNAADKRYTDLMEFRARAIKAIVRALRPELRPIMSGDSNAVSRLKGELARLESRQLTMKRINSSHKAFLKNPHSLETSDLPESIKQTIRQYVPQYSWEPHPVAPFELTNNGASIRRIKARIEQLSKVKALVNTEIENKESGITVEDCPAENRIRIFFPGKPSDGIRSKLKSTGFRWSPTIGAWQAYRNYRSQQLAREMAA